MTISLPGLTGYTAKGLPSGLKLNKKTGEISGAAKKPTAADGVTVTFTKKGAEALTTKFIVGPIPTINVTLEGDTEKCKVSGANKAYLVGKKVSLAAKGPKGTAFTGWFKDGEPWPNAEEYLNAKLKYVMTIESLDLVARFEKEKMSIDASALEGAAFSVGAAVAEGAIPIAVETQSGLKSLKAAKLPSGIKLAQNKKTGVWSISGTPKKAGTYEVKLTATAKSGATENKVVLVAVAEKTLLPAFAVGLFSGTALNWCEDCNDGPEECGPWTLSMELKIAADGSIVGKLWDDGPDHGVLKNGRIVSVSPELVAMTVELFWYEEEDGWMPKSIGSVSVDADGVLQYYDDDDPSSNGEKCPVQATLNRVAD